MISEGRTWSRRAPLWGGGCYHLYERHGRTALALIEGRRGAWRFRLSDADGSFMRGRSGPETYPTLDKASQAAWEAWWARVAQQEADALAVTCWRRLTAVAAELAHDGGPVGDEELVGVLEEVMRRSKSVLRFLNGPVPVSQIKRVTGRSPDGPNHA